jgi:predicted RNA-binding Zn ribbon-like protein
VVCVNLARVDRFDPGPQPAGRAPAPGRLAYVQAFLNSFWNLEDHGGELWSSPDAYGAWLVARGFAGRPTERDRRRALTLREALRKLALANHGDAPAASALARVDDAAAALAPGVAVLPRFGAGGATRLDPAGEGPDGALGLALGVVLVARADGTWSRLKACPHADCGWAFYDHSRNRAGQWCSMRICGNRTKGEAFRRRRRATDRSPVRT